MGQMILCPHCERPLEGHDAGHCARRMSRRFFFGLCAGAAGAIVAPEQPGITIATWTRSAERAYFASELGLYEMYGGTRGGGRSYLMARLRAEAAALLNRPTPEWAKASK